MTVRLIHADCLDAMRGLEPCSVDACVTDPPYGLEFMGKGWDRGVPGVEYWREVLRVLKPGGHLISFGGTRTYHHMACAIEDAGFEIRDQLQWLYGSGFPKSHNISKALDRAAGAEREVIAEGRPVKRMIPGADQNERGWIKDDGREFVPSVTAPATDAARQWDGWGTALKPAHEPIVLARKPLIGTVAENVLKHGTGAINVDGCRVAASDQAKLEANWDRETTTDIRCGNYIGGKPSGVPLTSRPGSGRWPANILHDGSDDVLERFPAEAGAAAPVHRRNSDKTRNTYGAFAGNVDEGGSTFRGDSGSAARFFYCAKASAADRNDGLQHLEARPWVQFQTGNGASGKASSISEGRSTAHQNTHPTVKPTDLMRWLVRLVTPPAGIVLDPFMGSGSTGRACVLEGFGFIGIERESDYIAFAEARIAAAAQMAETAREESTRQPSLFDGVAA